MKQRYGTELRSRTLASVKPEISQALESLLNELHSSDESKVLRSAPPTDHRSSTQAKPSPKFNAPLSSSVESVHVDPDGLMSPSERDAFVSLLKEFQLVFDSRIPGYNGAAGPI